MVATELEQLLQDQRQGRQLQEHVRPKSGLEISGFRFCHVVKPALFLSGDALDYFTLPDGRVLFYLLDVSGSGTAAALLCMFIKSLVRHSVAMNQELDAACVLRDVNNSLLAADSGRHVTMVCGILDAQTNSLQWCNAGHTPRPYFYNDKSISTASYSAQPLGLFADVAYELQQLTLADDFGIAVFSDGILDCLGQQSFLQREQLLASFVYESSGDFSVLKQRLGLENAQHMPDDISMLVIKRVGL